MRNYYDLSFAAGATRPFNSLFEMPKLLRVNAGPLVDRISFNSLFEMRLWLRLPTPRAQSQ